MKYKYILALALTGVLSVSCNDFLDERPQSTASVANFYTSDADINNAVTACYASLQATQLYGGFMITMAETRSDNIEDQNPGGNAGRDYNIDKFMAGADNGAITSMWQYSYNTIMRCNAVLENLSACKDNAKREQYEGEARFVRALMYFNLVRFYGDVPKVDRLLSPSESLGISRDPADEIYALIKDDLTIASGLLPKSYSSTEAGRATSGAALALLGKVFLTTQQWTDCKTTLERVLTSEYKSIYELLPDVLDVFKAENDLNKEMMFVVNYSKYVVGEGRAFDQYYKSESLLDTSLRFGYEATDARKSLLETVAIDKTNTPFRKVYDLFDATTKNVGYDQPVLRYADVYLMYAEALNEISYNGAGDAIKYLNLVRTRSGATAYTAGELSSQTKFRDAVLLERRLEFPLECHRWFDLIRTGTAESAMAKVGITITRNDYLYPIPKREMEICKKLTQNPGYELK